MFPTLRTIASYFYLAIDHDSPVGILMRHYQQKSTFAVYAVNHYENTNMLNLKISIQQRLLRSRIGWASMLSLGVIIPIILGCCIFLFEMSGVDVRNFLLVSTSLTLACIVTSKILTVFSQDHADTLALRLQDAANTLHMDLDDLLTHDPKHIEACFSDHINEIVFREVCAEEHVNICGDELRLILENGIQKMTNHQIKERLFASISHYRNEQCKLGVKLGIFPKTDIKSRFGQARTRYQKVAEAKALH